MKKAELFVLCVGLSVLCGCSLKDPFTVGDACPGITPENVRYTAKDSCDGALCPADVDAVRSGYCPEHYRCVSLPGQDPYCRTDCDTNNGEVMCDGKCIHPETDIEYCGASGLCDSTKYGDRNYAGENCIHKGDASTRYECIDSLCVPKECDDNQHSEIINGQKQCVDDSVNACGSADKRCEIDERCLLGRCTKECENGQVLCDGKCWDTKNNKEHCGAIAHPDDGHCYNPNGEMNCGDGGACIDGACVKNSCTDEGLPNMCEVGGERVCVNFQKDPVNCGNCGVSCETEAAARPHVAVVDNGDVCVGGKCQFVCKNENSVSYENCGTSDNPVCVNVMKDNAHCGSCGHACSGDTSSCIQGECQASQCPGNECGITDCVNNARNCGSACLNCYDEMNADNASCDDGVCKVEICRAGYHLVDEDGAKRCIQNTDKACGAVDTTEDLVDCTSLSNASAGSCVVNTGKCKVTCKEGYHAYDDGKGERCVQDDIDNCGVHGRKCNPIMNGTVICKEAECVLQSCENGFHKNEGKTACKPDSRTECGESRTDCTSLEGWSEAACENGECRLIACDSKHYKYENICIYDCSRLCKSNESWTTHNTYYCCSFNCNNLNTTSCKKYDSLVQCTNTIHCTTLEYCEILLNGGVGGGLKPYDPKEPVIPKAGPGATIVYTTLEQCVQMHQVIVE